MICFMAQWCTLSCNSLATAGQRSPLRLPFAHPASQLCIMFGAFYKNYVFFMVFQVGFHSRLWPCPICERYQNPWTHHQPTPMPGWLVFLKLLTWIHTLEIWQEAFLESDALKALRHTFKHTRFCARENDLDDGRNSAGNSKITRSKETDVDDWHE